MERIEPAPISVQPERQEFKVNKVLATPAVRKMAIDYKVNIEEVKGSGKDGRVLKDDIIKFLEINSTKQIERKSTSNILLKYEFKNEIFKASVQPLKPVAEVTAVKQETTKPFVSSKPVFVKSLGVDRKEAIKGVRKAMVKTMTQANLIPHFSYCDEYNMNKLVELRNFLKHVGKERGVNLSYLPILIKVCFFSFKKEEYFFQYK